MSRNLDVRDLAAIFPFNHCMPAVTYTKCLHMPERILYCSWLDVRDLVVLVVFNYRIPAIPVCRDVSSHA